MEQNHKFVVVSTTVAKESDAEKLTEQIIEQQLAACVQQIPIKSNYRWKGKVESDPELLLLSKTRLNLAEKLCAMITSFHPYEVPEITVSPITGGSEEYLSWIAGETQ